MNRSFYSFAALLTGLTFFISLIHNLFYFQLGRALYTMESFMPWFLMTTVISLLAALIMLKYFSSKKFVFSLVAAAVATAAQAIFTIIIYGTMTGMDVMKYYLPMYFTTLASGIPYGISLVIAPAGKRPWLRAAGTLVFILSSVFLVVLAWFTAQALNYAEVERINQWVSIVGTCVPGFFTMNFLRERAQVREEHAHPRRTRLEVMMAVVAFVAVLATILVTAAFSSEALGAVG